MNRQQLYVPIALAVLGFTVTFAILRPSRGPLMPVPSGTLVVPSGRRLLSRAPTRSPGPVATASPASRVLAPSPALGSPSAPDVPASDDNGPPLPVMLAVTSHPGQIVIDDDDASREADPHPIARQVDIYNTSSDLLSITVLAADAQTQKTTQAQVLMRSNGQAHIGTESGLKLEPGAAVTLRSRGYQEMTTTVP